MKNGEITVTHVAQEKWSSGTAFLLAAIGSAVGLGNIYRFPYVVGENGGGAFVLLYLGIVAFFGIPLVMTELTIGRRNQLPPISAFTALSQGKKSQPFWKCIGWINVLTPLGILGFYFVISGWTLNYVYSMISGQLNNLVEGQTLKVFTDMQQSPLTLIFWMTISLSITAFVIYVGFYLEVEFDTAIDTINRMGTMTHHISLSVFLTNIVLFFMQIKMFRDEVARGIFGATIAYAILVLILILF